MEYSAHNLIGPIVNSNNWFIVNPLHGNADILTAEEIHHFNSAGAFSDPQYIERGYVIEPIEEKRIYRQKYLDFLDARETDEVQLFFAPTYQCNFNCPYCYQDGYPKLAGGPDPSITEAFFEYVRHSFLNRNKYITLFGGEPLLSGDSHKIFLRDFFSRCAKESIPLAIVTNGYTLASYVPMLDVVKVREIQVTLDGPADMHNLRRPLTGNRPTFNQVVEGIDAALAAKIPVNLRVVVDRQNLKTLPELADFAIARGWTTNPLFKTQLGRNYELHYCQSAHSLLYTRLELYQELYLLIGQYPNILDFHKPAYSISKFLFEQGELPDPLFDSCPGCKTEWAFDYTGKIYSCTATIGKPGEELGTFYPEVKLNEDIVLKWQDRDVLSISGCAGCNLQLACGGGCASVAFNRTGELHSPDCRPVKDLLSLGISLYQERHETIDQTK